MVTKFFCGGDKEDRTPDLLNAIQALSQLSYTPDWLVYYSTGVGICQGLFLKIIQKNLLRKNFRGPKSDIKRKKLLIFSFFCDKIKLAHYF